MEIKMKKHYELSLKSKIKKELGLWNNRMSEHQIVNIAKNTSDQ